MRRRDFCKAAVPLVVPSSGQGLNGSVSASYRVTIGHIGVGGMGSAHVRAFVQIASTCVTRTRCR
jgi:hypothetical protein